MDELEQIAARSYSTLPESLAFLLSECGCGRSPEELVHAFKKQVPWVSCENFQTVPQVSKKGNMHISMLSFEKAAYTANGMYLSDAKMLLATEGFHGLERHTLAVKPRPGATMT